MADPFTGGQNSRAINALQKRQESLRKWKTSETARESTDRSNKRTKIKFSLGTVFLSAVSAGDVDEVKKLLGSNNDINYQNVDGLTALHQACIDENYELVSLLLDNGAELGIRDNEGWTPLHAAASCGSVEIAQLLIDSGADVSAVNNEGELPLDLAEEEDMEDLLTDEIERLGIDPEDARGVEEKVMLEDAQGWLNKRAMNETKDLQGASALHVASAKGYLKVINLLFQIGVDVNAVDSDGWTALHAAAHWGQKEACEILANHGAGFNIRNKAGNTPVDLAEPEMVQFLEELKKNQSLKPKINSTTSPVIKTNKDSTAAPPLKRSPLDITNTSPEDDGRSLIKRSSCNPGNAGVTSSITRIKDHQLFLKDITQERAKIEASRENTSPRTKSSRVPSFSETESPKEDKEKERMVNSKSGGAESSDESETEDSSEENSEEEESEEEPAGRRGRAVVNSLPGRTAPLTNSIHSSTRTNAKPKAEEESESETEESSSEEDEEEEPAPKTTQSTRPSSTPSGLNSPLSRTTGGRFGSSRDDSKEETTTRSRLSNFPARTTASSTSTSVSTTTSSGGVGSRAASTPSDDSQSRAAASRSKRVTRRAGTAFVAGNNPDDDEEEKNNDKAKKVEEEKASTDRSRSRGEDRPLSHPSSRSAADTYSSRRSRLTAVGGGDEKEKNEADNPTSRRNARLSERNQESEEAEMPAWKRRLIEREKQREKEKEKENEKARENAETASTNRRSALYERERKKEEKEKEKEKEDDSTTVSASRQRRRKSREQRRATGVIYLPDESDEDENDDVKEAKKNTKLNEEPEEKERTGRRFREGRQDETRVGSDRVRRGDALGASKSNAIEIKERDPDKLRQRLQESQLEVHDYKIKLEKALQGKEELAKKLKDLEEELQKLDDLKEDNKRLKDENGALIRVISKLTPRPT